MVAHLHGAGPEQRWRRRRRRRRRSNGAPQRDVARLGDAVARILLAVEDVDVGRDLAAALAEAELGDRGGGERWIPRALPCNATCSRATRIVVKSVTGRPRSPTSAAAEPSESTEALIYRTAWN